MSCRAWTVTGNTTHVRFAPVQFWAPRGHGVVTGSMGTTPLAIAFSLICFIAGVLFDRLRSPAAAMTVFRLLLHACEPAHFWAAVGGAPQSSAAYKMTSAYTSSSRGVLTASVPVPLSACSTTPRGWVTTACPWTASAPRWRSRSAREWIILQSARHTDAAAAAYCTSPIG